MAYQSSPTAAKEAHASHPGTRHWWLQRVTAVALLPLSFWAITLLDMCLNAPYPETVGWLQQPFNSACIVAWTVAVFYHAALGLQVVIEDYIAAPGQKIIALWAVNLTFLFLALAALLAVFRIISKG